MRIAFQSALIQKGGDGHVIQSQAEIGGHGSSVRIALDHWYLILQENQFAAPGSQAVRNESSPILDLIDLLRFIECGVKEL